MIPAMWEDGFAGSRAVVMNVTLQSDLVKAFDSFSFDKGAALIRMLESIIGENELKMDLIVSFLSPSFIQAKLIIFLKRNISNQNLTVV